MVTPSGVSTLSSNSARKDLVVKRRRVPLRSGLYVSDCVEFMQRMLENSIDLTITSPPYDNLRDYDGYKFDFFEIANGLYRITKQGGIVVWVVGDRINGGRTLTSFEQGIYFRDIGFSVHDVMIYQKKNTPFMRSNAYTNCYEFMFVLSKGAPSVFNPLKERTVRHGVERVVSNKGSDAVNNKVWARLNKEKTKTNIWQYAVGLGGTTKDRIAFQHPAVFPESLARDHILSWSNTGDFVFDPMCGSGTVCKMARQLERHYIGVDVSKPYIEIARKRVRMALNV